VREVPQLVAEQGHPRLRVGGDPERRADLEHTRRRRPESVAVALNWLETTTTCGTGALV
jgi:hypothetical protein